MTEEVQKEEVQDAAAVLAELRRAQADLKDLRAEKKRLEGELAKNDPTVWKDRAIKAETKLALNGVGLKNADRLLSYVPTDGLDFDEEGNFVGFDDKLKQLQSDLPELFSPKWRVGGKADIFADDAAEQHVDPFRQAVQHALTN